MEAEHRPAVKVALLGDSTLDNALYTGAEPDVVTELRRRLPPGSDAVLLAIDGSLIADVTGQLTRLPRDATHIVLSIGGNDALGLSGLLTEKVSAVGEAMALLADARDAFGDAYRAMLTAVLDRRLPTAICTIYEPHFPDPTFRRIASAALSVLNDVIIRQGCLRRLPIIDLRLICDEATDFINSIEPSHIGGGKIAGAIAGLLRSDAFKGDSSVIRSN